MIKDFLRGMGSVLNLFPMDEQNIPLDRNKHECTVKPLFIQSDAEAIQKDWEQVGADMWWAIGKIESENIK